MSRTSRFMLAAFLLLIGLFAAARLRYAGRAPVKLSAAECDADLWKHVFNPERLKVIEPCAAVEGRVVSLRLAADGDLHLALDPEQKSALNLMNVIHGHRTLAVEIICDHPPRRNEAVTVCTGFTSRLTPPRVGDRIRVIGSYVTDSDLGWNEIHPVTRIEILR